MNTAAYNRAFWAELRGRPDFENASGILEEGKTVDGMGMPIEFQQMFATAASKENAFRRHGAIVDMDEDGSVLTGAFSGTAAFVEQSGAIPMEDEAFTEFHITPRKVASIIKLRRNFVNDAKFDLEKALLLEFAKRFGSAEEAAFLLGDGATEPTGLLSATGGAVVGVTASSADTIAFDDVIKLFFSVEASYRRDAVWLMSDEIALLLRTMKDADGNYLWRISDDTILGRPVETSPFMPQIASGAKPILFGDLSYFWIFRRSGLSIRIIRETFLPEGAIGFRATERIDGHLIDPKAVKVLQNRESEEA